MPITLFATVGPFPVPDPIPLPAPVWLFKVLLDLTLTLHFTALYLLLGGLVVAVLMNWRGHRAGDAGRVEGSAAIAGWLPVIMTYVINLGVPPLLFAQVLYGRALYTSSVLIAAYWIAVIPILIVCYHLLYLMKARGAERRPFYGHGLISLLCAALIARIYSANMTLMLNPAIWKEAYQADQTGTVFLSGPASWSRWAYMVASGVAAAGSLMAWLALNPDLSECGRQTLRRLAGWPAWAGSMVALVAGVAAWAGQPEEVRAALPLSNVVWLGAVLLWLVGWIGVLVAGLRFLRIREPSDWLAAAIASLGVFLQAAGFVLARDLIRDAALDRSGFDVWDRAVVINWSVLVLFLVLFVVGLGVVAWLVSIAAAGVRPAAKGGVG